MKGPQQSEQTWSAGWGHAPLFPVTKHQGWQGSQKCRATRRDRGATGAHSEPAPEADPTSPSALPLALAAGTSCAPHVSPSTPDPNSFFVSRVEFYLEQTVVVPATSGYYSCCSSL